MKTMLAEVAMVAEVAGHKVGHKVTRSPSIKTRRSMGR